MQFLHAITNRFLQHNYGFIAICKRRQWINCVGIQSDKTSTDVTNYPLITAGYVPTHARAQSYVGNISNIEGLLINMVNGSRCKTVKITSDNMNHLVLKHRRYFAYTRRRAVYSCLPDASRPPHFRNHEHVYI